MINDYIARLSDDQLFDRLLHVKAELKKAVALKLTTAIEIKTGICEILSSELSLRCGKLEPEDFYNNGEESA